MTRRVMPAAIAALILAVVITVVWFFNRTEPIPSAPPASAPTVGSCWNVDETTIEGQAPWAGASTVACTAPHTAEVFFVGQVDHKLITSVRRATGDEKKIGTYVMATQARSTCTAEAGKFLGGTWRGTKLSIFPAFIKPSSDGFFLCATGELTGPDSAMLVTRPGSFGRTLVKGNTSDLHIDCLAPTAAGADKLGYVDCAQPHTAEFIGLFTVTPLGAPYDGPKLEATVSQGCAALVKSFVGLTGTQIRHDLRVSETGPDTADLWQGSDQTFSCYAIAEKPFRGTLEGLGTRPLTP